MKKKKKILSFVLWAVVLCAIVGVVYKVFFTYDPMDKARASVSEMRITYFTAEDDLNHIVISSGTRENPYNCDGKHGENVPFGIVVLSTSIYPNVLPDFEVKIGDNSYTGTMEENPYNGTYVTDIGACIDPEAKIELSIKINGNVYTFAPTNLTSTLEISAHKALDIALKALTDVVNEKASLTGFDGEIYVKLVFDSTNTLNNYYWYVNLVDGGGTSHSVIVDCHSGEIISSVK